MIEMMESVKKILNKLNEKGFKAYIVGGAVRDYLLGLTPSDIDITTDATHEEVMNIFSRVYPSGIKFGTVTVMVDDIGFEVTTFRTDGEYLDGRRPETVTFGKTIEEDLSRRDFSINSMAMDINGNIVDLFDGQDDLKNGIIRAVGDPVKRFSEDALRILRAFRFSARYGFEIEENTLDAIKETKEGLRLISSERVREELTKIILTDNVNYTFHLMYEIGVLDIVLPEVSNLYGVEQNNPYHVYDVFNHTLKSVEYVSKDAVLRWSMLLHDIGKPFVKENIDCVDHFYNHSLKSVEVSNNILDRLNFSNQIKNEVIELVSLHDREISIDSKSVRRLLNQLKYTSLNNLLLVKEADYRAQDWSYLDERLKELEIISSISEVEEKITVRDLVVNGNDLMELGLEGKEIGDMLKYLLGLVLDNPDNNDKEVLVNYAKNRWNKKEIDAVKSCR